MEAVRPTAVHVCGQMDVRAGVNCWGGGEGDTAGAGRYCWLFNAPTSSKDRPSSPLRQ